MSRLDDATHVVAAILFAFCISYMVGQVVRAIATGAWS